MKFAECMRDNGVSEFPDPDEAAAYQGVGLCQLRRRPRGARLAPSESMECA